MLVATFGTSTAWVGKTISFENDQFMLEDQGAVSATAVMGYDVQGHLIWAGDGMRAWVGARANASPTPASSVAQTPQRQRPRAKHGRDTRSAGERAASITGLFLLIGGLILAFYFVAVFDTSVAVDYTGPSYGLPERVNNVGLMQDRQIGIIVGFAAAIGGGVLMYIGRLKRTPPQVVGSPQQEQAAPMNSGPSAIGDHERLATLHQAGALTDDEFAALKSKLTR